MPDLLKLYNQLPHHMIFACRSLNFEDKTLVELLDSCDMVGCSEVETEVSYAEIPTLESLLGLFPALKTKTEWLQFGSLWRLGDFSLRQLLLYTIRREQLGYKTDISHTITGNLIGGN